MYNYQQCLDGYYPRTGNYQYLDVYFVTDFKAKETLKNFGNNDEVNHQGYAGLRRPVLDNTTKT